MTPDPFASLRERVVLVTGGSRGIGAQIARAFSAAGARVALTYRTEEARAAALAEELGDALAVDLDVTSLASIRSAIGRVTEHFGRLDVLVNNAGYLKQQPFLEITEEDWDRTTDTNQKGVFFCTQAAARQFERQKSGCVINVSSVGGQFGGPKAPHYSASKAAVISLTRSFARLLGPQGIRVNAIAPGFIRTEMIAHLLEDGAEAEIAADLPLARIGETDDVAQAALYLASDAASFVTGHVLNVNGGQLMS